MTSVSMFDRFDELFRDRITQSTPDGREGAREIRALALTGGNKLRCAMDEEQAHWYEVVFGDGESGPMRFTRLTALSDGDTEILECVLHENRT